MNNSNYFNALSPDSNFIDLQLYQYGSEDCLPLHSFGPAVREHFLFHYVINGAGTLFCRGTDGKEYTYPIQAHQGFLLCPNQISTYIADMHQPWHYAWVEFDGLRAGEILLRAGLDADHPVYQPKSDPDGKLLWDEMMCIVENDAASPLSLIGHLCLFLDQLIESSANQPEQRENQARDFQIHEAIGYIQEHYSRNLSVEEVVKFSKLSHNQFTRRFKKATGVTPQEYLVRLRLTDAANMLRNTQTPIKEIAASCGYSNPFHFSQAFRRFYGVSPREWRKGDTSDGQRQDMLDNL